MTNPSFRSLYTHGFVRAAICTPHVAIGDPALNAARTEALARRADADGAAVTLFPELGLSAYTADELFFQQPLLERTRAAIAWLANATSDLSSVIIVGAPLQTDGRLYNCAVVLHRGAILGVVPKSYLPNYREFYEKRYFAPGAGVTGRTIKWNGAAIPFGTDIVFAATDIANFVLGVEICEDLWTPNPPSTAAAFAGALVLANLSASNVTVGKAELRKALCRAQATRTIAAYLYSAAGSGESTTDLAWDGHAIICDDHGLVAESGRFGDGEEILVADLDVERLATERMKVSSWADCAGQSGTPAFRRISFTLAPPVDRDLGLRYPLERFPFVPADDMLNHCFWHAGIDAVVRHLIADAVRAPAKRQF